MAKTKPKETKPCAVCGRPFENRKKWASRGVWDEVKYCSERCRRAGTGGSEPDPTKGPA